MSSLYTSLIQSVVNAEFPTKQTSVATRMSVSHPDVLLKTDVVDRERRVVSVNLARAGTLPSHVCFDLLNRLMNPEMIRQDHILASRVTDSAEKVTGAQLGATKIGGDIDNAIVLFPDPMGATGHTITSALDHYKNEVTGKAFKYIALHLIVTPEYLKHVLSTHSDVVVYAVRLDRGLSPKAVLESEPGQYWSEERGLNDKHYIVPGGGGFGELMNNSFI